MKTGVKPIGDLEFDIDVGLRFETDASSFDAGTVRGWVLEAVEGHTKKIDNKQSCIRVCYSDGYHVDLVSYVRNYDASLTEPLRLGTKSNEWREASPQALIEHILRLRRPFDSSEDGTTKTDQFKRIIRYLRRWDDTAMPRESKSKPTGLAFVLLVGGSLLGPRIFPDGTPDDRSAMEVVATLLAASPGRLVSRKPTPEYEDLLSRLSDDDMNALKQRLGHLASVLREADAETDPVKACQKLRVEFGPDFPVPDPEEGARRTAAPAIVPSTSAA